MYSVVIIDDEIYAIQHLERLLKECEASCDVIACYTDAREALSESVCDTADILFVDIMMPTMDGLEFCSQLLLKNPYAKIVLLTAYKDFEFAKRAMEIGVFNYWVKHELRKTNIYGQMKKVYAAVEESKRAKHAARRQALIDVFTGKQRIYDLPFDFSRVKHCFLLYLQSPESIILEKLIDIPSIDFYGTLSIHGMEAAVGFVSGNESMEALRSELDKKLPPVVSGGLMSAYFAPSDYSYTMHDAMLSAAENCIFTEPSLRLADDEAISLLQYDAAVTRQLEKTAFEAADHSLQIFDTEGLVHALEPLWSNRYLLSGNKQALGYAARRLEEIAAALGIQNPDISGQATILMLEKAYVGAITAFGKNEKDGESTSFKVRRIRAYIHRHLSDDLQLKTLTAEFCISGDYLRKIFKGETGMTLSEYITQARLKEARRLLETGEYKIYEIAETVGYRSTHYFSQVFHRETGCYPTEYLENRENR